MLPSNRNARPRQNEAGFTVIEMLISFTILAIVSGSLFQMFFVATKNNERAVVMDTANGLAITAVELFKADAGLDGADMFFIPPGAVIGNTWRSVSGDRYVKYYDSGWRELEILLPAQGIEAEPPPGAYYLLEAEMGDRPGGYSELNYVASSLSLALDAEQEYRLVINENAGEIEAIFNGIPQAVDKSRIGRIISVNVEFTEKGALPKHIAILNRTSLTVNVNIFGIPGIDGLETGFAAGGGTAGGAGAGDENAVGGLSGEASGNGRAEAARSRYIEASPVTGPISVMYLSEQAKSADSVMRAIRVSVYDISRGALNQYGEAETQNGAYPPGGLYPSHGSSPPGGSSPSGGSSPPGGSSPSGGSSPPRGLELSVIEAYKYMPG